MLIYGRELRKLVLIVDSQWFCVICIRIVNQKKCILFYFTFFYVHIIVVCHNLMILFLLSECMFIPFK